MTWSDPHRPTPSGRDAEPESPAAAEPPQPTAQYQPSQHDAVQHDAAQYSPPQYRPAPYQPVHQDTAQYQPGYYQPSGYYAPQYHPAPPWYGAPEQPVAPAQRSGRRRRRVTVAVAAGAVAAAVVAGGVALSESDSSITSGIGAPTQTQPTQPTQPTTPGGSSGNGSGNGGVLPGGGGTGNTGNGGGTSASIGLATTKQKVGIVTVVSVLGYQNAEGAGTGMVLSSNGEILTNNHVVNGATSITVTVVSTGKSYRGDVVGTDPSDDVAVIQLRNASGLTTAKLGDSSDVDDVSVGSSIVGVGNAGGTGTLRASNGKVTALNQSITATDESGSNAERLHGLIGVNAPIISGDSGGPMYDADGEIIGMNTAASQSSGSGGITGGTTGGSTTTSSAYAIPIDNAIAIAAKIEAGQASSTIHIGLPGFMGVGVGTATGGTGGAAITSVLPDGPAAKAGITSGSVVTAVNGTRVTSPTALKSALSGHKANSKVKVTWTDSAGATHSATVTLVAGPAD